MLGKLSSTGLSGAFKSLSAIVRPFDQSTKRRSRDDRRCLLQESNNRNQSQKAIFASTGQTLVQAQID